MTPEGEAPAALSVVVPVYNGEEFIAGSIQALVRHLEGVDGGAELIIVDDGSTDGTFAAAGRGAAGAGIPVHIVRSARNEGKGAAIRRGMHMAHGARRVFLDADLAYPPEALVPICAALSNGADIAIASRPHPASRLILSGAVLRYFVLRYVTGRIFNWLVRLLVLPGVDDSQAGLKGFRARAASQLFTGWLPHGFSFDVALLFRARWLGMKVAEVPVTYRYDREPSTVRVLRDTFRLSRDLVQIRARLVSGTFEQWNAVAGAWKRRCAEMLRAPLRSPLARAILIAAFGLSLSALVFARLMAPSGAAAVLAWAGALAALLGFAWRADVLRPPRPMRAMRSRREAVLFLLVFAGCALLRFARLGDLPPMVHGDSAECGILGVELLHGQARDVFGFSPWYWTPYLSFVPYAASFWLNGVSVAGLRLPSAVLGTLAVVPLYVLVRACFGVRPALVAAALYATSHTAIHFGRIGLWNIQVLFYATSALALVVLGLRRRSAVWVTAAGVATGLALYSYTAGRLVPLIVGAVFARHLVSGARGRTLRFLAYYAGSVVVCVLPLILNYAREPAMFQRDRTASVWVFAEANEPHVLATLGTTSLPAVLWTQIARTFQGFYSLGDASGQYGTGQPILSPLTAALALVGLWVMARRWWEPRHFLLAAWLGLGLLLGSVLILDPPSHTRLIAVLPVPYILAALGIEACLRATARWRLRGADMVALCLLVVVQGSAFSLLGYRQFVRDMTLRATEWDVLKQMEALGGKYDYYLFTGPFLLADAPVIRLFSTSARAVSCFGEEDLPERLSRDSAFLVLPEYRRVGLAITENFPGVERQTIDQEGVRQMAIYRCTRESGCRRTAG